MTMKRRADNGVADTDISSAFGAESFHEAAIDAEEYDPSTPSDTSTIAAAETRWVRRSKILVFFVLATATVVCAYITFSYTSGREELDFENQFGAYAPELLDVPRITAYSVFQTIESMSTTITSYAIATNATWPYVTLPHYVARGAQLLNLSGSSYLAMSPLVHKDQRMEWEKFAFEHQGWLLEGQEMTVHGGNNASSRNESLIFPFIFRFANGIGGAPLRDDTPYDSLYGPFWQVTPPFPYYVNYNIFSVRYFPDVFKAVKSSKSVVLSPITVPEQDVTSQFQVAFSYITAPIFEALDDGADIVALYSAVLPWENYFRNAIPEVEGGLHVVVKNTCEQAITFLVDGNNVTYVGSADLHEERFSEMELNATFDVLESNENNDTCGYSLHVYPTTEFHNSFVTREPFYYTVAVVLIFALTSAVFIMYAVLVQRKDDKVMSSAERSNAIVSSLFPKQVRARLIEERTMLSNTNQAGLFRRRRRRSSNGSGNHTQWKNPGTFKRHRKPIADLFPNATVMFADIEGFTAWSSTREPSHVFILLEELYGAFDLIAKRAGVFKVETVGDCYVAVAGLPDPREDHALVMARFAHDCIDQLQVVVTKLEIELGPDTGDLAMRFGLHSGPVTAGVLRGEKTRFQLFGDTVNTAQRMESTGVCNKIHVSQETANCLIDLQMGHYLKPRKHLVIAKGKGRMQTYWVNFESVRPVHTDFTSSIESLDVAGLDSTNRSSGPPTHKRKLERLVHWNVDVLSRLLKNIVAMRATKRLKGPLLTSSPSKNETNKAEQLKFHTKPGATVLDEVKEIITLPGKASNYKVDPEQTELDPRVVKELHDYVKTIASMYRNNPFHNFDHASHVTQSVIKLLSRVVTPDSVDYNEMKYNNMTTNGAVGSANNTSSKKHQRSTRKKLHEYTYGITSDPLTQFACAFSAMIHDVDHSGVPNAILIKEDTRIAQRYRGKSVAEQNSVDLAWSLLEEDRFSRLRRTIYVTEAELLRFRQLVVNCVMATDIADKELGALRKKRWDRAFNSKGSGSIDETSSETSNRTSLSILDDSSRRVAPSTTPKESQDDVNRKATIVIEHLIQASDVSHTMQHWHIYLKWNERLFHEMYEAYLDGRSDSNPADKWYEGELGFFDYYLIPLGRKLGECQVFGVSSDEYLNYATANRKEWETKGREIVKAYMEATSCRPVSSTFIDT